MDPNLTPAKKREYATKLVLMLIFLSAVAIFAFWQRNNTFQLSTLDLVLLGLATLRLGRLIAFDVVTEPFRRMFTQTVPDETGAGDTVEPRGEGVQRALGQLISCPICAGTWMAAILVYGLWALPQPTRIFLAMTAAVSVAEILNSLVEALCWTGEFNRNRTGAYFLARREKSTLVRSLPAQDCPDPAIDGRVPPEPRRAIAYPEKGRRPEG